MLDNPWPQLTALFHAALARDPSTRDVFLNDVCQGDEPLRAELHRLLAAHASGESFLEPPPEAPLKAPGLDPGTQLGPYTITGFLGAGGMGDVYRARDARLGRDIAIKILPPDAAVDAERRARFAREAQAIAALNHPNIVTIYSVERSGDLHFLTIELVAGKTLRELIPRGGLPIDRFLEIGICLADAVGTAHRHHVVHRDLKPSNVMITSEGRVKVLDFGLAKLTAQPVPVGDLTTLPAFERTADGRILGTIDYMSPEQVEGREVDHRSDIFALGIVLYEMATGQRPFAGGSSAALISSILTGAPPVVTALRPGLPQALDRIIRRCLAKEPDRRYQSAIDLRGDLEEAREDPSPAMALQWIGREQTVGGAPAVSIAATKRPPRWRSVIFVAGGLTLAALGVGAGYALRPPPQVPVVRFDVQPPPRAKWGESLALSSDGRRLAFVAITAGTAHVWIRDLDSVHAHQLPGTDGASIGLFWSPDSASIGFFAKGRLKTIRADSGQVHDLASATVPGGGTWNRDDVIVYSPDAEGLWRVPARGGEAARVTTSKDEAHRAPVFLPDGRHLLYSGRGKVFATSLDDPSQRTEVLSLARTSVAFVAPGYLLFFRDDSIWAQRFDPDNLTLSGDEVMIAGNVDPFSSRTYRHALSAADSGVLAYRSAPPPTVRQFVWVDRKGRELSRLALTGALRTPVLSPDETRVAFTMEQSGNLDIHVMEIASGVTRRLTFSEEQDDYPVWSHDSQRLAFRRGPRPQRIFEVPADGKGIETQLFSNDDILFPRSYTRDGRTLIYVVFPPSLGPNGAIFLLPLTGDGSPREWLDTPANEVAPLLSPDNKWMVYGSQEANRQEFRQELYVQRYPERGAKAQVSEDGWDGGPFEWRPDGLEFFYAGPGSDLWAVPIEDGARSGPREKLFNLGTFAHRGFSVAKDGRFLVNRPADGSDDKTITVVMNWLTLAKK